MKRGYELCYELLTPQERQEFDSVPTVFQLPRQLLRRLRRDMTKARRRGKRISGYVYVMVKRTGEHVWRLVSVSLNLLTTAGRDWMHAQVYTNTSAGTRGSGFVAVSAEVTAPVAGDTTLVGEITTGGLARADATTKSHTGGTNATTIEHEYTASATHTAVHKSALFNASSAGQMTHAAVFPADATLQSGDKLKVSWPVNLG
jgi:hypothetical protein